jgi:coenzyme PQQ precursor peptide PqqA
MRENAREAELRRAHRCDRQPASSNLRDAAKAQRLQTRNKAGRGARFRVPTGGNTMAWTTPVIVEVCVGMEITSYESAEF